MSHGFTKQEAESLSYPEMLVLVAEAEYKTQIEKYQELLSRPAPPMVDGKDYQRHLQGIMTAAQSYAIRYFQKIPLEARRG